MDLTTIIHFYFIFFILSSLFNIKYLTSILEKLLENYKTDKYFSLTIAFLIFWFIFCVPVSIATIFLWILNTKNKITLWFILRRNKKLLKELIGENK